MVASESQDFLFFASSVQHLSEPNFCLLQANSHLTNDITIHMSCELVVPNFITIFDATIFQSLTPKQDGRTSLIFHLLSLFLDIESRARLRTW
jgi:hypothetical protein